jgi:DNA polymerase sigma
MPTLRQGRRNGCKYETNSAFGKRRIPYTSSDVLEKPKEEPKKTLDPHEDEKLSGDMRELYDRLEPSKESTARRRQFVDKLQNILETEWPGNEFKVHVFGSSGNMLYTSDSDGKAHRDCNVEAMLMIAYSRYMYSNSYDTTGRDAHAG